MQPHISAVEIYQQTPLDVIFQAVDDGITVQEPGGRLVYANAAAALLIGYDTAGQLLAAPIADVIQRHTIFDENRNPVPIDQFPGRKALLGMRPAEVILGFRVHETGVERWSVVKAAPIFDESGAVVLAVNVFSDITERKRAADERERLLEKERAAREQAEDLQRFFSFLAEAGQVLASSLDYETTLSSVASLAVPHIADWCVIHIVEEDGSVQQLAVAHVDPLKVELARELERKFPFDRDASGGASAVLRTGEAELTPEITDELLEMGIPEKELLEIIRGLGMRSAMTVPLIGHDAVLGVITMVSAESGRRFGAADLALARELASRAALAVENARLHTRSARAAAERAAILEHMADGVVLLDAGGTIVYMNRAGRELTGLTDESIGLEDLTRQIVIRSSPDQQLTVDETALGRALQGETVLHAERWFRRPDSTDTVVRFSATPILDELGAPVGAVGVFSDITSERRLEQDKDAFLTAAAHDLKTPLATIKGLAQVMQRRLQRMETPENERLIRSLIQIDDAVMRMTRLLNDLLDVSRIQMGRPLDLNPVSVDLASLLRAAIRETQHTTTRHRIRFTSEEREVMGVWDADRLSRVFGNLLSNAVKYSPDGGDIAVSLTVENGSTAVVTVRDQGIGVPAAERDRIFERFYRARNVNAHIQGTGVGLASVQQIVDQHGGIIRVQSEEGKGSLFEVHLPIA